MNEKYMVPALPVVLASDPVERLASLFDAHHERLYRLARRMAPSTDDALDLVQETFLRAAKSPKSIPIGASNEEAWLVRVLINTRRDQWRKTAVRDRHDKTTWFGSSQPASGGPDPEAALIAKSAVWQALDVLPPRRRAIIVMCELEGLAIPTIAALLGISAVTVRWHLSIGKRDLSRALKPYMGDTDENY
jgi:RNA polymerase sigma-70 factor, ECF subfamily